ncbi:MarR family winged helix-turn-helix transcriptional regulator [Paenibacillus lentus]|uniref:MarR family transcriptional regulator n=1 Tax=Paenibacillus lentus TaxID=1338368 RepID=A0A3Q8SDY8_9BACL|nr:MarR family transcriptional regulator [Paenibacillus lentus]AZK48344.1 MarR family transcriptional regulator [Paenibacillus lentus]
MDPNLDQYIDRLQLKYSMVAKKLRHEIMQHREQALTGPQFHMLSLIAKEQSCNVTYLAESLVVKPSAITVMLDRLVQSGYVERRHDDQDRRAVLLSITEQGKDAYEEARKKSREVLAYYFGCLDENERTILERVINKFDEAGRMKEK